jgi:hypothetical protein
MGEMEFEMSNYGETALDAETGQPFVLRATDPNVLPQPYVTPGDFAAQYPTPLDPTEILAMCEEVSFWRALPTQPTQLKQETWRELNALAFTSGSSYVSFADGECPEEYSHSGANTTVTLKNIGAKKSLSISDIMHSRAVAGYGINGINSLLGGLAAGEGLPGASDAATFERAFVADVKQKEMELASVLVLNQADRLLVEGNSSSNSLEWDGVENWATNFSCTMHTNDNSASGTFSAIVYDRHLSETCAKPTALAGHPQAIQEVMSAYFQLGWQGSQVVNVSDGNRITPGFNFAGFVNTGVGRLAVIADSNFNITDMGNGAYQADIWSFRMTHNGVPLVYRRVQIPLAFKDLAPGCTAVSFQIWEKSALVIKHCCAHGQYTTQMTGRSFSGCPTVY